MEVAGGSRALPGIPPPGAAGARAFVLAGLAYAAALALLALAVLPLPPPAHLDFQPTPDAPEYLAGAMSLLRDGTTSIAIAGEVHPSRYPPGYTAVVAGWIAVGVPALRAPFVASAFAALAVLALVGVAAWRVAGALASGVAVLALAAAPGFLALARAPMAETTSVAMTTAGALMLARWSARPRAATALAGSTLLGLAVAVRLANGLLWPLAACAWLTAWRARRASWRDAAMIAGGLAAGSAPLWWHQARTFGDPFANGYQYWVPGADTFASTFGLANVAGNLGYLALEAMQQEWRSTVAALHGNGDHLGPAGFVLGAWAIGALRASLPRWRWLLVGLLPFAAAMLAYEYRDARFFAPVVPFAAIAVGVAVAAACSRASRQRRGARLASAAVLGLLALHVAGVPGPRGTFSSLAMLRPSPAPAPLHAALARLAGEPPGAVLVTCNPVYARAVLGGAWLVAPANDDHDYRWNPARFVFGREQRDGFVGRELGLGRPVYLLVPADDDDSTMAVPAGARRVPLWSQGQLIAARLVR